MGIKKRAPEAHSCDPGRYCKPKYLLAIFIFVMQVYVIFYLSGEYYHLVKCRNSCLQRKIRSKTMVNVSRHQIIPTPPRWTLNMPETFKDVIKTLYDYIENPHAYCEKLVSIGGQADYKWRHMDGHKWVCLDPAYELLTTDECLIYSIGINNEWSFDDNAQLLGCEIYALDPSMTKRSHNRSHLIHFYRIGVGGKTEAAYENEREWEMRTYADLVHMLGHENRTVHYLKTDVEAAEWDLLEHVLTHSPELLRNVMQIGMEVHMGWGKRDRVDNEDTWRHYLDIFMRLERLGFRLFHSEVNPYEARRLLFDWSPRPVSRVYELVWLNQPWSDE